MKTFVVIETTDFQRFLAVRNLPNSPESFQQFLSEIGTIQISFTKPIESSIAVPSGSCIRLHSPESYRQCVETKLKEQIQSEGHKDSCCIQ